jgi:PKD repeat protein
MILKSTIYNFIFLFASLIFLNACAVHPLVISKKDRYEKALEQEIKMTKDPATNLVPKYKLAKAKQFKDHQVKSRAVIAGIDWHELGPNNCGGRTRCVWVDLNDLTGKTVWTAGVGGGLWKTTDITASTPIWIPNNDLLDNIAITDIAQDPINKNIMYFSTGEGYGNADRIRGIGIFKSIDSGNTWTVLPASSGFTSCHKLIVTTTGTILVSTFIDGVHRSSDGGTTFTKVLGSGLGITGALSNNSYDVEQAANGDIYASLSGSLHKSTNDGITFNSALSLGVSSDRIEIAVAPSNANVVYLAIENGSQVNDILSTANAGTTWTAKALPVDADGGISPDFTRGQAWYDLSIGVDPNNDQVLFIGGIDIFKSTNGATSWSQISHWYGGFGFQDVHADQHDVFFSPGSSSKAFFTNDGGIYYTDNATSTMPTLIAKEEGYNTTQFYACAIHPTANTNYFLAGSQDNGTHSLSSDLLSNSVEVTGGDGAYCHIDQDQPQYQFTSYVYNNYFRSTNGGASFNSVNHGDNGQFINPTDYDDVNNRLYAARNGGEYLRWDNPQTGNTFVIKTIAAFGGSQVSAVTVSPNTANRVYFGLENGDIIQVDNANAVTPTATSISTGLPSNLYLKCIEIETGNENHILITYSNYGVSNIWETTNGGTSWTDLDGNLPDMPVRWILLNPSNGDQALIATELGVWSTDNLDGAATIWGASNTGLANTRVDMLQTRVSDKLVIAATHGRGLFYSDIFTTPTAKFNSNKQLSYVGKNIQFTNTSYNANSYAWDFGDGTTSTLENPIKSYTLPGLYDVTLTINSGVSTITKTDFIQILPTKTAPYTIAQGGNFEINPLDFGTSSTFGTPFEKGSSAVTGKNGTVSGTNAWVTGLTGNYLNGTKSYLYTPNFSLASGGYYYLQFATKYIVEDQWDGMIIESSIDSGTTWQVLGSTVQASWYNFSNNPQVSIVFPFNQAFFTGSTSNAYQIKNYDISAFQSSPNVAFRFAFKADDFAVDAGVAIDNVEIIGPIFLPLSLNITSLDVVKYNTEDVQISWIAADEKELENYTIQRSKDGMQFTDVRTIFAKQINNCEYAEIDSNPWMTENVNKLFYRIKSILKDGVENYSAIKKLNNTSMPNIYVGPIPCNKFITINSDTEVKQLRIISIEGQEILKVSKPKGNISLPSNMTPGTYIVILETKNTTVERKILKQ